MRVIELQYLPQPAYIAQFLTNRGLTIDGYEYYVKQTYRNRCAILTANGIDQLSVPVLGSGKKILSKDIKIDYNQKWLNRHWRAIRSAYGRAPYFEYYADGFEIVLGRKHKYLFDLSMEMLTQCLDCLQFDVEINTSNNYIENPEKDLRDAISLKSTNSGSISYKQLPYQQVFGSNFVEGMSALDLIFCEGPQAGNLLKSGII